MSQIFGHSLDSFANASPLQGRIRRSGLLDAVDILKGVEGISFINFDERDVVRHSLVQRIVRAYEKYNESVAGRQLTLKLSEGQTVEPVSV